MAHSSSKNNYRPEIDGSRALAVGLVVLFHANLGIPGGFVGVDVFFVISGYLITRNIISQTQNEQFSYQSFYTRRIRRILPASTCMALITFCYGIATLPDDNINDLTQSAFTNQLMCSNFYFWQTTGYFDGPSELKPLLHTWSLAVEEQFYLIYPFLLATVWKLNPRSLQVSLWSTILISIALCELVSKQFPDVAFFLLPFRMWELLLGGAISFLSVAKWKYWCVELLSTLGIVSILTSAFVIDSETRFPSLIAIFPCAGTAAYILANSEASTTLGRLLSIRPFVFVGLISYSLYLWHWPVFVFGRFWFGMELSVSLRVFLIFLSLIISIISWKFVESPFRHSNSSDIKPLPLKIPIALSIVLAGISICIPILIDVSLSDASARSFSGRLTKEDRSGPPVFTGISEVGIQHIKENRIPVFGSMDAGERCLVWGDSHAMAYIPGIDAACTELGVKGFQITHSSTPPLVDFIFNSRSGLNEMTPAFSTAACEFAISNEIDYVILSGVWKQYAEVDQFEVKFFETLKLLNDANISVAVVLDVASAHSLSPFDIERNQGQLARVSLEDHRRNNIRAEEAIWRLSEGLATIIDPAMMMVDDRGNWRSIANEEFLYRDQQHLSVAGGKFLTPLFEQMFIALRSEQKRIRGSKNPAYGSAD